jgi:hypothetical protein
MLLSVGDDRDLVVNAFRRELVEALLNYLLECEAVGVAPDGG